MSSPTLAPGGEGKPPPGTIALSSVQPTCQQPFLGLTLKADAGMPRGSAIHKMNLNARLNFFLLPGERSGRLSESSGVPGPRDRLRVKRKRRALFLCSKRHTRRVIPPCDDGSGVAWSTVDRPCLRRGRAMRKIFYRRSAGPKPWLPVQNSS